MKTRLGVFALLAAMLVWMSLASATEYFVAKQGNDANNGTSRERAFLTIQKGVDALKPGDTLMIGPGEYFEQVKRADLGGPDAETVIRAEIPRTAVMRGDVPAPEFKKVDGYRFVYAAPFDRKPESIIEHNKMHTLVSKANVAELEFDPGFFHYDEKSKMLYISNLDLSAPDKCRYTICVTEGQGLELHSPRRVRIEGLAGTGFRGWGVLLFAPVSCVVRDCVMFMNVGGICLQPPEGTSGDDCGSDNVIEDCVCYGNNFGGIVRYTAKNDIVRNCYTYKNIRENSEHFGIMHYHSMKGPFLVKDNISWGQNFDYSIKPNSNEPGRLEGNVGLGFIRNSHMFHNLIGGGNESDRESNAAAHNILFLREEDLDKDIEFADHLNLDFRLQPDSRFRGTAPDGSDRGPYPYEPNIFYVSPTGNDQADGLSIRKPWRTLARAFRGRGPGDTVYLSEGRYAAAPLNGAGDGESPVTILGRGRGTVVISGKQNVTASAGIVFERLNFADGMALNDCRDVRLKNCTFFGNENGLSVEKVEDLKVTHCVFADVPVDFKNSSGVFLSGNLYANKGRPAVRLDADAAVLYSDYNGYRDAANCWQVAGAAWSLADLQERHDHYSRTVAAELDASQGAPRLVEEEMYKSVGPASTALGTHHEYDATPKTLSIVGPFLHSTSDTTANIEWWASHPAMYSLAWGETPDTKNVMYAYPGYSTTMWRRFNTYSLTGLEPGRTYYFRIVKADARRTDASLAVLEPEGAPLSFKTAIRPAAPCTYYVAGDGNDANDGLSRQKAFRTLCRAANGVGPGDTVLIAEGEYNETVRIRAAGTQERPITFRCVTGEKALHRGEDLPRTFQLIGKPDNRFDGIYFRGQSFWRDGFVVVRSPRVQITRCLDTMVNASESPEMLVKNCVLHGGWTAVALSNCPNSVVENNVCINTILRQLTANGPVVARLNIFCECARNKTHQTLLSLSGGVTETDNCFYLRWPEEEKLAINDLPLPVYRLRTGSNAMYANPMMPGARGYKQGWPPVPSDADFDAYFSANPDLILRGIGLQPEAFTDFKLGVAEWPYDRAWAEKYLQTRDAGDRLARAGRNAQAMAAYTAMAKDLPMCDRLKADILGKASVCAQKMKNYSQAMQLAKDMPVEALSMHRQMEIMLERKQYKELLAAFTHDALGGRNFHQSYRYPELEDVMADLYYYRSLAYTHAGDLKAAEADLRIMNDKRQQLSYRCGEAIHDLTWLRLGDFYRMQLKDDNRALEAYLNVCNRKTWAPWARAENLPDKPVLTGDDETLVKATEAACAILRKQGNLDKVRELQESLAKAKAEARAALRRE